jgi:hypothetical protein
MRIVFFLFLFGVCVFYALWKGGKPEREAASVFLGMLLFEGIGRNYITAIYSHTDFAYFIVDLAAFVAFSAIALRANRLWPLCIAALQMIALVSHVARYMDFSIHPVAYLMMQVSSSYPSLIILAAGTWRYQQRKKKNDDDLTLQN